MANLRHFSLIYLDMAIPVRMTRPSLDISPASRWRKYVFCVGRRTGSMGESRLSSVYHPHFPHVR
jgi:hypothetical protein